MPEPKLTERQQTVLRMYREGRTPTEIGRALGVTPQAVHGSLRRLRKHGQIPARGRARPAASNNGTVAPEDALDSVRRHVEGQIEGVQRRIAAIDTTIGELTAEREQALATLALLRTHLA